MPNCEWVAVDCPSSLYKNCPVRLEVGPFLKGILAIEQNWEIRTIQETNEYVDLSDKLGEIACGDCPLRKKLFDNLELDKLTDKQLNSWSKKN